MHSTSSLPSSTPVLIVGGGPVGMLTALQLAVCGTKSVLVERNDTTARFPKMEYSNMRTMEMISRLSKSLSEQDELLKGLRCIAVPGHYPMLTIYSTKLLKDGKTITTDDLPIPDSFATDAKTNNDGTRNSETPLRCSQILVEAELKRHVLKVPDLISAHWSVKFESLEETEDGVMSQLTDLKSGQQINIKSLYVVGCDGGGSRVRRSVGFGVGGDGPFPMIMYLIHFRSRDFASLRRQGRFWHQITSSYIMISQNEDDIWTLHHPMPPDTDISKLDPWETLHDAFGKDEQGQWVRVDEILETGKWQPASYIVDNYRSVGGKVFLAGDAAHQRIPAGGYGYNTGVGDAIDIGWKLSAVLKGTGGLNLLSSYNCERRPVSIRNTKRAQEHWAVQSDWWTWVDPGSDTISSDDEEGVKLRQRIHEHLQTHNQIHRDYGIESGYRYNDSPIIIQDRDVNEPVSRYEFVTATTWPGARTPHVFLRDGKGSTHHCLGLGLEFTLFDFTKDQTYAELFKVVATSVNVPLKTVNLHGESHVRKIYERDVVLVRPDGHVAWRLGEEDKHSLDIRRVLETVIGRRSS